MNENKFIIDLDDNWKEWGYFKKQKATDYMERNFTEGIDFLPNGSKASSGGRPSIQYFLTEECAFKMAKTIQTEKMTDYKSQQLDKAGELVDSFGGIIPKTYPAALRAYADEIEKRELVEEKLQIAEEQIIEDTPKVKFFKALQEHTKGEAWWTIKELSKQMSHSDLFPFYVGSNKLANLLREGGVLMTEEGRWNQPRSKYVEGNYVKSTKKADNRGYLHTVVLISQEGIAYLLNTFEENIKMLDKNYKPTPGLIVLKSGKKRRRVESKS